MVNFDLFINRDKVYKKSAGEKSSALFNFLIY